MKIELFPLDDGDQELIDTAAQAIRKHYKLGRHHVAAVAKGQTGRVYVGLHLDSPAIDICAEAVAIGTAATSGDSGIEVVVAVSLSQSCGVQILSPCGLCRELIYHYSPNAFVIVHSDSGPRRARISDLLPLQYRSQYNQTEARGKRAY